MDFLGYFCGYENGSSSSESDTLSDIRVFDMEAQNEVLDTLTYKMDLDIVDYYLIDFEELSTEIDEMLNEERSKTLYLGFSTVKHSPYGIDPEAIETKHWLFWASDREAANWVRNVLHKRDFDGDDTLLGYLIVEAGKIMQGEYEWMEASIDQLGGNSYGI